MKPMICISTATSVLAVSPPPAFLPPLALEGSLLTVTVESI